MNLGSTGSNGESYAAEYLQHKGYEIITRNFSSRFGEIDIVCKKDNFIVFVEVKTRCMAPGEASKYGAPADAVDRHKRYFLTRAARTYTSLHPTHKKLRFDVIEVYLSRSEPQKILAVRHMKDAFRAYS